MSEPMEMKRAMLGEVYTVGPDPAAQQQEEQLNAMSQELRKLALGSAGNYHNAVCLLLNAAANLAVELEQSGIIPAGLGKSMVLVELLNTANILRDHVVEVVDLGRAN